jgi:type II secretory pathway pseudopilin PulG
MAVPPSSITTPMSYEKTRPGPPFWMLAAILLLIGLAWQLAVYQRQQQHKQLRDALGQLQLEIERYAVDSEGSYPSDLATFIAQQKINLPRNPYGRGQLKILKPSDPWQPGGIVYVAWGPQVLSGDGTVLQTSNVGPPLQTTQVIPTDFDSYLLLGYGRREQSVKVNQRKAQKGVPRLPIQVPRLGACRGNALGRRGLLWPLTPAALGRN